MGVVTAKTMSLLKENTTGDYIKPTYFKNLYEGKKKLSKPKIIKKKPKRNIIIF